MGTSVCSPERCRLRGAGELCLGGCVPAWLRLSFGSPTPVCKVTLPFQLAGKDGTPGTGSLWGEGKGTFVAPTLERSPSGFLGQPGGGLRHRGGRRGPPLSWNWLQRFKLDVEGAQLPLQRAAEQQMWAGSCRRPPLPPDDVRAVWQEPGAWGQRGQSQAVSAQNSSLWCGLIYASVMKTLPAVSPGARSWQKPCLLARWEVMSRCAQEPLFWGRSRR